MILLVFTACLLNPDLDKLPKDHSKVEKCQEFQLQFAGEYDSITPYACMKLAQPELAKWINSHPNWRIAKFGCMKDTARKYDI